MHWLSLPDLLSMLGLGAALGFFGGLFGIGGGIIAVPFLGLAFGMEQALAQGTALAMMVPILLVGWWRYNRRHPIAWKMVAKLGGLASVTTWLIASIATNLNPLALRIVFSVFLLALAIRMLTKGPAQTQETAPGALNPRWIPLVGMVGGTSMGLLGIGGGLVATPFFTGLFRQSQTVAQSLSLALVTPCSVVALLTYSSAQRVDWSVGLPLAVGGLLTVASGVALAHRLPERTMKKAFAWMILVTAIWLLVKSLWLN